MRVPKLATVFLSLASCDNPHLESPEYHPPPPPLNVSGSYVGVGSIRIPQNRTNPFPPVPSTVTLQHNTTGGDVLVLSYPWCVDGTVGLLQGDHIYQTLQCGNGCGYYGMTVFKLDSKGQLTIELSVKWIENGGWNGELMTFTGTRP